ncbi:MAG: TetR/AcrR family transcriptional regulator [Pseudomonadota bacterium]
MARRRKIDAQKTRSDLITGAAHLFETKGYADTSIAEICSSAGTTKGALFHHFSGKEDVFRIVWTDLQVAMDEEARAAATKARSRTDPYAAFLAGCRTYLKYAVRRDYQQIVLIDGPSVLGQAGWYESDHNLGTRNVSAGIRYLSRKGIVAENRIKPLAIMVQSALNGAGFALSRKEEGVTVDGIADAFEAMVKSLR